MAQFIKAIVLTQPIHNCGKVYYDDDQLISKQTTTSIAAVTISQISPQNECPKHLFVETVVARPVTLHYDN